MRNEYIQKLLTLMSENPELPVMCKVDSDIVAEDGYAWWLGGISECSDPKIDEYSTDIRTCVVFKSDEEYEEWFEDKFDIDDYKDVLKESWDEFIKKKVDEAARWEKAIFITISPR